MRLYLCLLIVSLTFIESSYAHFVWLEPDCKTEAAGTDCKVLAYFGEYSEGLKENKDGRLAERKGLSVFTDSLATPLKLEQQFDHYLVPSVKMQKSSAVLAIDDSSEVVDMRKYGKGIVRPIYYARAVTAAPTVKGTKQTLDIIPTDSEVSLPTGKEARLDLIFRDAPASAKVELMVFAPNGWAKELKADEFGKIKFIPLWSGRYVIEAILTESIPGEFKGKSYEAVRHRATLSIVAKE